MENVPIVEFDHVYAVLQGRTVLENINFSVLPGSFIGIIGPNGAGKTTLLRLILGLLPPSGGQVRLFGMPPEKLPRKKRKVGYLPQKPQFDRRFPASVRDIVLMGAVRELGFFRRPQARDKEHAEEVMSKTGILDLQNRPISELSGGQQKLVFLAGALVSRPRLLILDEPAAGLDPYAQHNYYRLLKELQTAMRLTVLSVSHDLAAISANAHKLICINKTMHTHGSPAEVLKKLSSGNRLYKCEFGLIFNVNGWGGTA
jgi:zinc transport system ATP-binding protein